MHVKYIYCSYLRLGGHLRHLGRHCIVVGFTTTYMQLVPISTKILSSYPAHGEVYWIQHNDVIKFVNHLQQVGGYSGFLHQ